jgi:Uma2 family endonuclease
MVVAIQPKTVARRRPSIAWVKPPEDFVLDDTPVDNTGQPLIAGALRESLELAGRLPPQGLVAMNFGLCVKIEGELTLKAPDWLYVPQVNEPGIERKSYTPNLEGEGPIIVMEFLSETEGGEYSHRRVTPMGKWYFYEEILKVPTYIIFEPDGGLLEVYRLENGRYELELPDFEGRHWFAELGLFLGAWRGVKADRTGYWLRWWEEDGSILPWAVERLDQEKQRAEQEKQRADRLAEILRAQGIDPDSI